MITITQIQILKNNVNILTLPTTIKCELENIDKLGQQIRLNHVAIDNLQFDKSDKINIGFKYTEDSIEEIAHNFINQIENEIYKHFSKGNKTLGTLPTDWEFELTDLIKKLVKC